MASASDVIVRTQKLTKTYGRLTALSAVDLCIERGEVFGYLGPNGAGKSTTLRLLMGMLRPTSGTAELFGIDAFASSASVRRRVGYVPGELALYPRMTGRQHIDYVQNLRRDRDTQYADAMASRLDLELGKTVRALSKGNRQKLALVLALMTRPELLILDEPTGGLDPLVQLEFYAILREHTTAGGTVLLSSHVLSEVQRVADRVGVLRDGHLVAVETLEDLQAKSLHHVVAEFADPVDVEDFRRIEDVRDVVIDGTVLRCSAPQSALDGLVKHVARYPLIDFECAEASLDETFLALYGSEDP
ncbi:ABC transporter ATP-binding protein [Rhodococcus sp. NPDC003348]